MRFKKVIRKIHLWLGLSSGLVVCLLCLSGALFVFAEDIMHACNKDLMYVEPLSERKAVDVLVTNFKEAFPQEEYFWINTYNDPTRAYDVISGIKNGAGEDDITLKITFINPYTGQLLGSDVTSGNFFFLVAHFHSQLLMGQVGLWIIRIASLIFLIELVFGLILWWPTSKNKFKTAFKPKYPASRKRVNHDLHRVYGFYACWLLLISVVTGLVMSFEWVEKPVVAAFGGSPELVGKPVPQEDKKASFAMVTLQSMYEDFAKTYPKGQKCTFFELYPDSTTTSQHILIDSDDRFLHLYGDSKVLSRYTGKLVDKPLMAEFEVNQDILEGNLNIHMGTIGGLPTQILALLIGLFGASLPITGFLIWWHRSKKAKAYSRKASVVKESDNGIAVAQ